MNEPHNAFCFDDGISEKDRWIMSIDDTAPQTQQPTVS